MSGFGRKGMAGATGMTPGAAMAMRAMTPDRRADQADGFNGAGNRSAQLDAFLAAERSRDRAITGQLSQVAASAPTPQRAPVAWRREAGGERSMALAYVFWWFCAPLAAHRFYLRAYRSAWAMAGLFWGGLALGAMMSTKSTLSVGGVFVPPPGIAMILVWMVWCVVDLFLIPGVARKCNEAAYDPRVFD
jgi:TM2 domain-containing membrane protein YozV